VKLVLFERSTGTTAAYGVLTPAGVVPLEVPTEADSPQAMLHELIDGFDSLRPRLEALTTSGTAIPLDAVRLLPPVPRPGKMLVTTAVYGPDAAAQPQQLLMTLKSAESVVGSGDTVRLPAVDAAWQFVPQAALGLVIRGPAKDIDAGSWQTAVFGYTCAIDVMARGDQQFGRDFWLAKADTLGPLGPCIVTPDELSDPSGLRVRSWQNGEPAQDFSIADASHSLPDQVAFATTIMTLHSGDVLVCGTSPLGQRPVGDAEQVKVEIDGIGRLTVQVAAAVGSRA
jgi:2-keto-4-pentenoate hydratase/2-oxohepta-3-ene-1,7-dioic acid hydratase in catechol pathway